MRFNFRELLHMNAWVVLAKQELKKKTINNVAQRVQKNEKKGVLNQKAWRNIWRVAFQTKLKIVVNFISWRDLSS